MTDPRERQIRIKAFKPPPASGEGISMAATRGGHTLHAHLSNKGLALPGATEPDHGTPLHIEGGRRYVVGRVIARGGMGVIYEAYDLNLQRYVAMKVLPKDLPCPAEDLLRFIEEAQITSQLEHPSIVPLHDLGLDTDGNVFYTMKLVHGMTLTDILIAIRKNDEAVVAQYPLVRLLNLFLKVCDAVAFAHSRDVIHRDLKPDNIMVGSFGEVQVMDWGLARRLAGTVPLRPDKDGGDEPAEAAPDDAAAADADDLSPHSTSSSSILGSPGFMAPEQVRGDENLVRQASDIYALGAILYSMLVLKPSVAVKNDTIEALRRVVAGDIRPPHSFNGDPDARFHHCPGGKVPQELSDIVMKAMAINPEDRYPTVQELQASVEEYLEGKMWHLVLEEDFSRPDAMKRWKVIGGEWEILNGELRVRHGEPQLVLLRRDMPGDVCIEFECYQEDSYLNDVGCFLSAVLTDNEREIWSSGYEFKYGAYDNSLIVLMRSDQKLWQAPATPLARGKVFKVRAERVGARLRFVVNDEEIFNIVDRDPLTGSDRVAVGLLGWRADTRYRWVRVYTIGTPWRSDPLQVAERQLNKGRYATAMDLFEDVMQSFPDADRMARAKRGFEIAWNRLDMSRNLNTWKTQLEKAWPGTPVQLRMANDGLTVEISNTGITDLSPLRGLPLNAVYCAHNRIRSLEPLTGMPLTTLNCSGNPIEDLGPLHGMPLTILLCEDCRIESLEPLRGMNLVTLNCGGNRIADIEPLRGMPLTFLGLWDNRVENLEPVRGMPLASLIVAANRISDLEPVRGLRLSMLHCGGNPVRSLEPVREIPLDILHCGNCQIESLAPLAAHSPAILSAHCNRIASLEPLNVRIVSAMTCGGNPISNLGGFAERTPTDFMFDGGTFSDGELEALLKKWSGQEGMRQVCRNLEVTLAMRRKDTPALKAMAGRFEGRRYLFIPHFMSWNEARAFCEAQGGHLLTITSEEENRFVSSLFEGGCWCWMGLETTEQGQRWVTGEPFAYNNFVDVARERRLGPKIFSRRWYFDHVPGASNCFVIEWDG
jgi:serine/threonine protein kinase